MHRHTLPGLLLILLLATLLRFTALGDQELRGDEAFSWNYVANTAGPAEIVARIITEGDPQPPLHYLLLQTWTRLFGDSEWALRSQSALLSLLLIPLTYTLTRQLGLSPTAALLAAALTALHPFQIWLAQDARSMYQLALIGLLVATTHLPTVATVRRSWLVYVLAATLAMYSHYYALFGLLAHGLYILFAPLTWPQRARWVAAGLTVFAVVLPWAVVILPVYAGGQLADPTVIPPLAYLADTLSAAALGVTVSTAAGWIGALVLIPLAAFGAATLRRQPPVTALALGWVLIALLGIYAVTLTRATFNLFYFIMTAPALYLLVAAALADLWQHHRRLALTALTVIALAFGLSLSNLYLNPDYSKSRGLRELAATLADHAHPGDLILANFPDPATVYYLRDLDLPYVLLPTSPTQPAANLHAALDSLTADHPRLWHIPIRAPQWDADGRVETYLATRTVTAAEWTFNKVRLRLFAADPTALPAFIPAEATFTDGLTLVGGYFTVNGQPITTPPRPGDWLRVTLLWRTPTPPSTDLTVFVHLLGDDGRLRASHDSPPANTATATLTPGQTLLDIHEFQLPTDSNPATTLTLRVGLYIPATLTRLTLPTGDDAVSLWASPP